MLTIGPSSWTVSPRSSARVADRYARIAAIGLFGNPYDAQKAGPYPPVPSPRTWLPPETIANDAAWVASANGVHIRGAGTTDIPVGSPVSKVQAVQIWKASGTPPAGVHRLS
jgi:hypothetical protein